MGLNEFSNKLLEFIKTPDEGIKTLYGLLDNAQKKYFAEFELIDDNEFMHVKGLRGGSGTARKAYVRKKLEHVIKDANKIIVGSIQNDPVELEKFYDLFFEKNGTDKPEANIKEVKRHPLYHIAATNKYEILSRERLFVLPNSALDKSGKYRYNQDGFPCLYMARTLYTAWEETRRPDFEKANFVLFAPMRELRVMSIFIEHRIQTYGEFVMAYFAMISSMKTKDDDSYHYQYVVPNLFMSILKRSIKLKKNIDGIRYLSSRCFDGENFAFKSTDLEEAFVFPQRANEKGELQPDHIISIFKMTDPRNYFYYKIHRVDFGKMHARISDYDDSLFYAIEMQLRNEKAKVIKKPH